MLTVGPAYRNHRGGVGAVIEVYSRYYEEFNFIVTHKTGSNAAKSSYFLVSLARLIKILIRNRKIKIVHIHGASYGSFYRKFIIFLLAKYIFRKKIIYHIHGGGFQIFYEQSNFISRSLIRTLFRRVDIVICLSQSWYDFYERAFRIKRLIILPNIVDYPVKDNYKKQHVMTLLFMGLVCKAKGIYDLIEVINRNKEIYRGKLKLIIGGNGEIQHLKELIVRYDVAEVVDYMGWITATLKSEVLNNSDIFILPSYNEGLPISILEAMSYAKPVIATNVGGVPEIVSDKVNGLLIKPGDLDQIEKSISYFMENKNLIIDYGVTSEKMVQKHLPHMVIPAIEQIYKSIL